MSRVVLVTGGTRGIGRAIADAFAAQGATVAVAGRRDPGEACPHAFFAADVREPQACEALIEGVVARFGTLDVLVNNAGGAPPSDTATASPRFHAKIVALNLTAPLTLAQLAYRHMKARGGVIVNVASVSGRRPSPGTAAYGAAKAGLINLTRTLAVEWAPTVRVVCVTPGLIWTEQAGDFYTDGADAIADSVPMRRFGTPEEVADACVWLASDHAAYISGTDLVIDGGGELPAWLRAKQEDT